MPTVLKPNHARKALGQGPAAGLVRRRVPHYPAEVGVELRSAGGADGPTARAGDGSWELRATMRRFGELDMRDELAALL